MIMPEKPKIVIVSTAHNEDGLKNTFEGLNKANIGKGTLVLVETPENCIKDPSENVHKKWIMGVNNFVASKKAVISSFEPNAIFEKRNRIIDSSNAISSISIGINLASEEIMAEIIKQKAKGRKKVVIVTGYSHGSRIADLLQAKGFKIEFIKALRPSPLLSKQLKYYFSKRRAITKGSGNYQKFGTTKTLKYTQLEKADLGRKIIETTKWKTPTTFRFGPKGKLVPVRNRAKKR